ncbi:hypothetical protein SNEBB_007967 [Seison nebaliae]|nr:hypothetical protein SNEBB_007967 [Seison nebaliae]
MKLLSIFLITIFCISVNCSRMVDVNQLIGMCSRIRSRLPDDPIVVHTMVAMKMLPSLVVGKLYNLDRAPSMEYACAAMNKLGIPGN